MFELFIFTSNYIFLSKQLYDLKNKYYIYDMKVTVSVYKNKWQNYHLGGTYLEMSSNPTVFSCFPAEYFYFFHSYEKTNSSCVLGSSLVQVKKI